MADYPKVNLAITPGSAPFAEARAKVEELAEKIVDSQSTWVISQSFGENIHFEFCPGQLPANFEVSVAGRVFSRLGEVRWLRVASECRLWLTLEGAGPDATSYRVRRRRYYLWGMHTQNGEFTENRTPGPFRYPLPANARPKVDDRAYIEVAEYLAEPPTMWPKDLESIEKILNQPEIAAHRYLRVDFSGKG